VTLLERLLVVMLEADADSLRLEAGSRPMLQRGGRDVTIGSHPIPLRVLIEVLQQRVTRRRQTHCCGEQACMRRRCGINFAVWTACLR